MSIVRSSFLRNVAGTLFRQLASGLLNLLTVILVARILGPAGNGSYAVALLLPTLLATFLNFGVSSANVYYLASRNVDLKTASFVTLWLSIIFSVFGLVIGTISINFSDQIFPGIDKSVLFLSLASFPFLLFLQAAGGLLQGTQDFRAFNLTLIVPSLVTLLTTGSLAALGRLDLHSVVGCYLSGQVLGVIAAVIPIVTGRKWRQTAPACEKRLYLSRVFSYGLKAYASNVVTFFNYRADLFLVNFFLGPFAAGLYVVAMQFAEKLWLLSQAVSTVFLPKIAELSGNEGERQRLTPLVSRWTLLLTLFAAICLGLIFDVVVRLLIGNEFSGATLVLLLLLPGVVAWAPARVLANDMAGRGRPDINLYIACVIMGVNLAGNLILIPLLGLMGAALSTLIAYCLMLVMTVRSFVRLSGVGWRECLEIRRIDIATGVAALSRR
ncbi:oligosaccharide flippase family protein [Aquamicrobium sp.]|uniref:oligosaccharide flippase family protein n=1 Tax=Aquamicrobium sp. TaxID=1872579 RepID=UPI002583D649|nr:oligosaccharide flippase family protein [Aquamicrobium sp.]MCK9549671.1 oligosaccharide flippase family protein [Aquamicrobium sp.]